MFSVSRDYATAVVPPDDRVKERVEHLLCEKWHVERIEFFTVASPDVLFAHGVNDPHLSRLCSRISNSLAWQPVKRLAVVSWFPEEWLTEMERSGLLGLAVNNLHRKFPGIDIQGVLLDSDIESGSFAAAS